MASDKLGDTSKNRLSHNTSNEMERGAINPSGPTTGTEGAANHASPETVQAGRPDAKGPGDIRRTSYPRNEAADNPVAKDNPVRVGTDRKHALEDNPNNRAGKSFRCADVGVENCSWSVTGTHEDEILGHVRDHAREQHNISEKDFDNSYAGRVRGAIRDKAA